MFKDEEIYVKAVYHDGMVNLQVNADNEDESVTVNFPEGFTPNLSEIRFAVNRD